jgi:60S ribosome subunit biogenesis protein NIP7
MRALTTEELQVLFSKLANYAISLKDLIAPIENTPESDRFIFRLHQSRCYYIRLSLANMATCISRDSLLSLGICLGMI